ncbi:MAG: HEAT repeat domain-containing protein [Planctomycetota bacterium]|jgi:hypothetical protein
MDRAAKYIHELKSSTSLMRKFAARYLKDYGDDRAIEPLIEALSDEHHEVRREAADTLGVIGNGRAVEALQNATGDADEKVRKSAEEALKAIAGRTVPPVKTETGSRDMEEKPGDRDGLVLASLKGVDAELKRRKYGYKITVDLISGRKQVVRVVTDRSAPDGDDLLVLFTVCAEAAPERYAWALKANARLPYGALALREFDGKEQLILIETLLEEHTGVHEFRKALLTLAEKGDYIESRLTGLDRN